MAEVAGHPPDGSAGGAADFESLNTILATCPATTGAQPQAACEEVLSVPKGSAYYITVIRQVCIMLVFTYVIGIGVSFIFALVNVASGDCGQQAWNTSRKDACSMVLLTTVTLGFDPRCQKERPASMTDDNWRDACGNNHWVIIGLGIFFFSRCFRVKGLLERLPGKLCLYRDCFTVVALNGQYVKTVFYADIVSAILKSSGTEIELSAKAVSEYEAKKKASDGRVLTIGAERKLVVPCGNGDQKRALLDKLSSRLPVPVQGHSQSGATSEQPPSSRSMLAGRVQRVADVRKSSGERALWIPRSCNQATDFVFLLMCALLIWYVFKLIGNLIEWGIRKAENRCGDVIRTDVDYCAVHMIFLPIKSLQTPADFVGLAFFIICMALVPFALAWFYDRGYHFDRDLLWASPTPVYEAQPLSVVFQEDISSAKLVKSSWEGNKIVLAPKARYKLTYGVKKPFVITMTLKDSMTYDIIMEDTDCAALSCHRRVSAQYNEDLVAAVKQFLPGMLDGDLTSDVKSA